MLEITEKALTGLPDDVVAVEVAARMVLAYWLERPGTTADTVSELAAVLRGFQQALNTLDARIEVEQENKDS